MYNIDRKSAASIDITLLNRILVVVRQQQYTHKDDPEQLNTHNVWLGPENNIPMEFYLRGTD